MSLFAVRYSLFAPPASSGAARPPGPENLEWRMANGEWRRANDENGVILILVLWVLVAISLLAISFAASIRTEVNAARNVVEQKEAYYLARAGIEYSAFRLLEARLAGTRQNNGQPDINLQETPDVWLGGTSLQLANGSVDVEIVDETGKINLNQMEDHLIYNLLLVVGVDANLAATITDSILDWRDPDEMPRDFGAESDFYLGLEGGYNAKNGLFSVAEELLMVRGVTPEIYYGRKGLSANGEPVEYYGLQKYFTAFSNQNKINVNSAPAAVLASIPDLDYDTALQIIQLRQSTPIRNIVEISEALPAVTEEMLSNLTILRSTVYTLTASGRVNGSDAIGRIRCVIRLGGPRGYTILYWNESNLEL